MAKEIPEGFFDSEEYQHVKFMSGANEEFTRRTGEHALYLGCVAEILLTLFGKN